MQPIQPSHLFPQPFAQSGNRTIIPETAQSPGAGRAALDAGFPVETQLPLSQGGVAPNRLDFNGILYMLSAFAFWQQSGGQWTYNPALNYAVPGMVYYGNKLWWCVAANGPDTTVVTPGTNESYWLEFLRALAGMAGGGSSVLGNPVGTVIMYHGVSAPDGYLICNGSAFSATSYPKLYALLGKATTPDMRGMFVRGYDPQGVRDPNGVGRSIGNAQTDAGRNITGKAPLCDNNGVFDSTFEGFFYVDAVGRPWAGSSRPDYDNSICRVDASRCWGASHTAAEFRPVNINLLYCIKHD
jgi:hypothetical protein